MTTDATSNDPVSAHRTEGFERQEIAQPGLTSQTHPTPDHGENSYVGSGTLLGHVALITGGDSGIGRAVAIAYAREGADVAVAFTPDERTDAEDTAVWIERAGRRALLLEGDVRDEAHNEELVASTIKTFGRLDILVINAGYQHNIDGIQNLRTGDMERVLLTNLAAALWVTRAAVPHLKPGASIITTSSIQAFHPSPNLIDYAMTKAALVAMTKALAQELTGNGIRVNSVAPGPIWTPLIPATSWPDTLPDFGQDTPLGRAGQPAELASAYVFLASPESTYVSGAVVPVTGGKPL